MSPDNRKTRRLAGVFLLGWVLLNYPILSIFNLPALLAGIPLLYAFVFSVWVLIIALVGVIIHCGQPPHDSDK
jgi:hypothetical protein